MAKDETLKVLLVEDDLSHVTLGVIAIEQANRNGILGKKMMVEVVRDGEEAIAMLSQRTFDLVLLDLRMPKIDGFEVLRFAKQTDFLKRIPIIVLTTSNLDADIREALDNYANAYLVKPLTQAKMIDMMIALRGFWASDNVRTSKS